MRRTILAAAAALFCLSAFAETKQIKDTFSSFTGIDVAHNFTVTLTEGNNYSVTLDVDSRVSDYCRMYLKGTILVIEISEKDFSKELNAQIRKNGITSLVETATITVPPGCLLQNISLAGNASLSCSHSITASQDFTVNLVGNTSVTSLIVETPKAITINAERNVKVNADLTCASAKVKASGSSEFELRVKADEMSVVSSGSSSIKLNSDVNTLQTELSSSSQIALAGNIKTLKVTGKGSSYLDALNASVSDAELNLSGSDCDVNAANSLKINAENGAKIVYDASPSIVIDRIQNSTVIRPTDKSKSKH